MDLFDLHCDTAYECAVKLDGVSLMQGARHLSLKRGNRFRRWTQVFAVFMPDELRGEEAVTHYEKVRDYLYAQERQCAGHFRIVRNQAELHEHTAGCAAILSVEGGSALAGQPERVQALYDDGVRLMTLTWNDRNEIGDGIRVPGG
ncbi:MAG: membrane dipeptidase, partial [Clostridia bacterium]|nr:membrane dipeptidase [Clostridia bacterium]